MYSTRYFLYVVILKLQKGQKSKKLEEEQWAEEQKVGQKGKKLITKSEKK